MQQVPQVHQVIQAVLQELLAQLDQKVIQETQEVQLVLQVKLVPLELALLELQEPLVH